jgi:glutaredoxin 3
VPKITIYTTRMCSYCLAAKQLLKGKGVDYEEFDVSRDPQRRQEMMQKAMGRTSVPQIWIDDTHVGGFDELYDLERRAKLDGMLAEG